MPSARPREVGLRNIDYAQADILKLGSHRPQLRRHRSRAACCTISPIRSPAGACCCRCCGRAASWRSASTARSRAPTSSRRAPSSPSTAIGASADDIRRCRQDLIAQDGGARFRNVYSSDDFFTTSACRDLLFHVQEHRLTLRADRGLPGRERARASSASSSTAYVLQQYRAQFPADKAMTDLASWDAFERAHPSTFLGHVSVLGAESAVIAASTRNRRTATPPASRRPLRSCRVSPATTASSTDALLILREARACWASPCSVFSQRCGSRMS